MERRGPYAALDLECEEGTKMEKSGVLSGMFKRSSKPTERAAPVQDNLSAHSELSASNDRLNDNTKEKSGMFSGMFKKAPKSSQDNLSAHSELSASSSSLNNNNNAKEKGGMFTGMLKKTPKPSGGGTPAQDNLSAHSELSASNDSLSDSTKEKSGMFSGMFKKASKQSQDNLSAHSELSASNDNLNDNTNTKKGGVLGGLFRNPPKPSEGGAPAQASLSVDGDLSASRDRLSDHTPTKEKPGVLGGMFKRSPKPAPRSAPVQDNVLERSELSASNDSLSDNATSKNGLMGKILRNPFHSTAQDKGRMEQASGSRERPPTPEKHSKSEQDGASETEEMLSFSDNHFGQKQQERELELDSEETTASNENLSSRKQNVVIGAMSKLNPFRSAPKKGSAEAVAAKDIDKAEEKKPSEPKRVSGTADHRERKERVALMPPAAPCRPTEAELNNTVSHRRQQRTGTEHNQVNGNMMQMKTARADQSPMVPPRAREKELNAPVRRSPPKKAQTEDRQDDDGDEGLEEANHPTTEGRKDGEEEENPKPKTTKAKKPRRNPFMTPVATKGTTLQEKTEKQEGAAGNHAEDDDEGLEEANHPTTEGRKDGEEEENPKTKKAKKTKNPFMPRFAKGKTIEKKPENTGGAADDDPAENDGPKKSLMDQLDEFRIDRTEEEDEEDLDGLMEWWSTVEQWEDMPQDEDMTEKEEAKAFAVTAEKVQKGIRVFNKLFSERAEGLWQHVINLNAIADGLDRFSKRTKIAQITGGSTSAIGGVATIAGLVLAPFTLGTSLIVTAVGLGVATAGGLTSASAGISNTVNNSLDRKKVEHIVEDYQNKMADLNKCMKFIKQGIENLRKFNLLKIRKHAYNRDFPGLTNVYEDGAMAGKAILINANEIMRVVQIANVAGSTAARAVQIASMATGVLTGLFVGMDIYFVAKDSRELKKGAKSEFAAKIREVAEQLHEGLVELNSIREELQATETPEGMTDSVTNDGTTDSVMTDDTSDSGFSTADSSLPETTDDQAKLLPQ